MDVSRRGFFGGLAAALTAGFGLATAARRPPPPSLPPGTTLPPPPPPGVTPEQAFLNQILAFRRGEFVAVSRGWRLETPKGG
jgi:hypothetical protein